MKKKRKSPRVFVGREKRKEAINKFIEAPYRAAEIAAEYGVTVATLHRWVNTDRDDEEEELEITPDMSDDEKIVILEKKLADLKFKKEVLEKVLAQFNIKVDVDK